MVRYRKGESGQGVGAGRQGSETKEEKHGGDMGIKFEESIEAEAVGSDVRAAEPGQALAIIVPATLIRRAAASPMLVPQLIADAGENASLRFIDFFTANIRNPNTR